MSDKLPSPWSAEFYEANTVKKIGGDIEHGVINNAVNNVKYNIRKATTQKVTTAYDQDLIYAAAQKYKNCENKEELYTIIVNGGLKGLGYASGGATTLTDMIWKIVKENKKNRKPETEEERLIRMNGNKDKPKNIYNKTVQTSEDQHNRAIGAQMTRNYEKQAAESKRVIDEMDARQREMAEKKRREAAANAKAKKGGKDRM